MFSQLVPKRESHIWSLGDQALVSGSNFVAGVLLARVLGLEAFGAYVVAQAYLLYANTFQASLVVSTMMTAVPAEPNHKQQRLLLRGFFGYTLLVLLLTLAGVQLLAWCLGLWSEHLGLGSLAGPLALAMIGFQLQDWLRRALYVDAANRAVFFSDMVAYGGYLMVLAWLALSSQLSPSAALIAMGLTFLTAAAATAFQHRIWPSISTARSVITQHWRTSRDLLATWQLQWLGSQGVLLLGAGMIGAQAAGAIRAAQNLLGPINVAFQWMDNVVPVRAARKLRDSGSHALLAYLGRIGVAGSVVLGLFALLLVPTAPGFMAMLYGEAYRPFAILVVFHALYYLFGHGYRVAAYYQRTIGSTRVLAHASLLWALASVAFALLVVHAMGERGIMLALVVGEVVALIYLAWAWCRQPKTAPVELAGDLAARSHAVLRRRDGSVHLVLPLANTKVLRSALLMYFPSRWTGRLYRLMLTHTLGWRVRLGGIETLASPTALCSDLNLVLTCVPNAEPKFVGLLKGAPGPRSKWTLKVMDARGHALAYARVAESPDAIEALTREATVLKAAADSQPGLPRVLAQGPLAAGSAFYLIESAGPERPAVADLTTQHFDYLASLLAERSVPWCEAVDQLGEDLKPLATDPVLGPQIDQSLAFLRATSGPHMRICIEHGDFAPWNIRLEQTGALFVLDWEHARCEGFGWLDALHFCYQTEVLVKRRGAGRVVEALLSVFDCVKATRYAELFPVTADQRRAVCVVYLLRMLSVGASEGQDSYMGQQQMRLLVLDQLREIQ